MFRGLLILQRHEVYGLPFEELPNSGTDDQIEWSRNDAAGWRGLSDQRERGPVPLLRGHVRFALLGRVPLGCTLPFVKDRDSQVKYATLSFYLNPSVGFGKQIARIIAPEKFDGRPKGDFDNRFREGTLRRLRKELQAWLQED